MKNASIVIQASNINETFKGRFFVKLTKDDTIPSFLIRRLIARYGNSRIIVATSTKKEDDAFQRIAQEYGVYLYRGDYENLASRLYEAVLQYGKGAENLVRINANSPLVDFELMDKLLASHVSGKYDYSYNEYLNGTLWGTGCEVFSLALMHEFSKMPLRSDQFSTLGSYIRQNSGKYKTYAQPCTDRRPFYKVNIETDKDVDVVREIVRAVPEITAKNIADYLDDHAFLAKYNLEFPPKETGTTKLFLTPEKVASIRSGQDVDYSYPISVELTLTNRCNLNCVYCSDMELRRRQGMGEKLPVDVLYRLFDDLAHGGTKGIVLEGGGEPTMYEHFSDIVRYAKRVGLATGLITNGTQGFDKDLLREFEWIRVSLDASTADEYRALKGRDLFEQVMSNIAEYAEWCPSVGVGYVVTNQNISQIESLVMRLREMNVAYIQCRPVVDNAELYPTGIDLSYLTCYQTKKFGVMIDGMKDNAARGNHDMPCYAHSITSIISGDGSVYICGRLNIYEWLKPIGNITRQSFRAIWNGDERTRQARMIQNAEFCAKNCPQCRISKFNVLFDKLSLVKSVNFI